MSRATPSSLKWLIDNQTRLVGEVEKKQEQIAELKTLIAGYRTDIRKLQRRCAQVEAVMGMHEIKVEPKDLRPIRAHKNKAVLRHGAITHTAYAVLRIRKDKTATTREIAAAVVGALPKPPNAAEERRIRERVRVRLCIMAQQGYLIRLPQLGHSEPNSWRLAKEPVESR